MILKRLTAGNVLLPVNQHARLPVQWATRFAGINSILTGAGAPFSVGVIGEDYLVVDNV